MIDLSLAKQNIESTKSIDELDLVGTRYLGRNGEINKLASTIKDIPTEKRKEFGIELNKIKLTIQDLLDTKRKTFNSQHGALDAFDTSLPGIKPVLGHLHPTTLVTREINEYFRYLGYSVYEGPEIETDEYNFNKLNLPKDHPAREMQDTLYIEDPEYLLRTHTSSVETRCMTQEKPPIRIVSPGKTYRNESTNASNNAIFYMYEGLVVDKGIHMGHLRATLEGFARFLFGNDVPTRFRCKYYPQVEPGAGLDIQCQLCKGVGCAVCKYRGWIEMLGAGMVHPNALKACGIDPDEWSGFAFGVGLDRVVMMKYGITDIRTLYNGELVWKE